jgi:hypothetical protein
MLERRQAVGSRGLAFWQLLQGPSVAVWVAEGHKRAPRLNIDLAGGHTTTDELSSSRLDILHDDLHALLRARGHLRNASAKYDGAGRSRRSQLDEAKTLVDRMVVVGDEADLIHIKGFRPVDVAHRDGDELKFPVHA